jgi:hypothetical protein
MMYVYHQIGTIFNWDSILSTSMGHGISKSKHIALGMHLAFFMSSYLLDITFLVNYFPGIGWKRKPSETTIHKYYQNLWEYHYKIHYTKICD